MLSRRILIASTAVLAAGCSMSRLPFPVPGLAKKAELTWVSPSNQLGLNLPWGVSGEELLHRALVALEEDTENPYGPAQGGYNITLRHLVPTDDGQTKDEFAAQIRELKADLVTVSLGEAVALGERGVLLPLEQFSNLDGSEIHRAYFPSLLEQFSDQGALYALPVDAGPLMLYYDSDYFELEQVPPVDSSWDWNDLVENAVKLTRRRDDGTLLRWGLAPHLFGIWWALWQNEAEVVDSDTLRCRLQEPAATQALQFFSDLIHSHRVTPPLHREIWDLIRGSVGSPPVGIPPAMVYSVPPLGPQSRHYHLAELPRGKTQSVPVNPSIGIAIAAQTESAETAYLALKGLVDIMQQFAIVPAGREAAANLGEIRSDLHPEEIGAIQRSLEAGRGLPWHTLAAMHAMDTAVGDLVRGDDVATVVNHACSLAREYQQTGGQTRE